MTVCGGPPRIQHRAVALHDSRLLSCDLQDGRVRLRIDAYVHASLGEPGRDRGTGWSQLLELEIDGGATLSGAPPALPLWIAGGTLQAGGKRDRGLLPLPLDRTGDVHLVLEGDGRVEIRGTSVRLRELGEATFIEAVPEKPRG